MDKEKVIKGLECCENADMCSSNCPYEDGIDDIVNCTSKLAKDALELLKEQQKEIKRLSDLLVKHGIFDGR